jgi:putative transposase
MQKIENLIEGKFYHIFNRGINSCNLFNEASNYEYFIELYDKYVSPVAETFAWVLMPNHFHFLVRIKEDVVYKYSNADRSIDAVRFFEDHKWETIPQDLSACEAPGSVNLLRNTKTPKSHLHFSHLFNAYSSYINKRYNRHGSLFERPFKRKRIENEIYLKHVVHYIHNNPVIHGFCEHPLEYPWSSYLSCISKKPTKLFREKVIRWFEDEENFKLIHNDTGNTEFIEEWLEL